MGLWLSCVTDYHLVALNGMISFNFTLPHHYVQSQRGQQEPAQGRQVVQPHEANPTDAVSLDLVHGEQANCEDPGNAPGTGVEEQGLLLYCLTAPLGNSSQEPGDGQNDPPHTAGHGEEIQHHEEEGAGLGTEREWTGGGSRPASRQ